MKRNLLLMSGIALTGIMLVGCGNSQSKSNANSSSTSSESTANFKVAKSSNTISADGLTPKQTASLVMYYSGVKNNQPYVRRMMNKNQSVNIELYGTDKANSVGVSKLPNGAQVIYKVSLKQGKGSAFYTIVGNNFYVANERGQFNSQAVSLDDMAKLANKNNAGDMINRVAKTANLLDKRNESQNSSSTGDSNSSEMTFDEAADLIQKGGFEDFIYDRDADFHDGSHATSDGGYIMYTYPGAKGQDIYTITKTGKNKYHIEAKYGTLDGGSFTQFTGAAYGKSSADVTK